MFQVGMLRAYGCLFQFFFYLMDGRTLKTLLEIVAALYVIVFLGFSFGLAECALVYRAFEH